MPCSACIANEKAFKGMMAGPLLHSSTTGGNPSATAAAIATINVMLKHDLPGKALRAGKLIVDGVNDIRKKYPKLLSEIRGKGLFLAMEFTQGDLGYEVVHEMFDRRVLVAGTLQNSKTIRVEPPLMISDESISKALEVIEESCGVVYKRNNL
jgi:putrescine aminotransferase